ncbi:hypothetical protein TrVE_jg5787 [Triparma verrucosa]|uniref:Small VCP/p97-interacting protein n=2 Tax=Triparma TaxID=722752 RepID=A0A9W7AYB1_9STRA|nr:hypothetical protein TrST_g341 [Triparma strigata]GMH95706.1 hypothetical protein TrVE_jg5787 [Triparma verrucosa]|mmetsp:Transcript_26487/g.50190  ORF Transcript_26487/g.50190 Transcript_26487/m.50190 type:complete len:114 (-) Transcript_26487:78-419(-)
MGNLCCGGDEDTSVPRRVNNSGTKAFSGKGHALGTTDAPSSSYGTGGRAPERLPDPIVNPNLDQSDRDRIRAERAAAAEKRLKDAGGDVKKKKKKKDTSPLRNPNAEPLMRWS